MKIVLRNEAKESPQKIKKPKKVSKIKKKKTKICNIKLTGIDLALHENNFYLGGLILRPREINMRMLEVLSLLSISIFIGPRI